MVKYDFTDFLLKVEEISQVGLKYSTDNYALDNYYAVSYTHLTLPTNSRV